MAGRFSIEAVFKAVDRVTRPVSRMQNRVGKFTRSMSRGFIRLNRTVKKFGSNIKRGAAVAGVALVGFGAILSNLIMTGSAFGRAIGSAAAKFPDKIKRGTQAFKDLEDAARQVGATTEFTATQAAQGLNFLAKAGFDAKFSVRALGDIVNFATAAEIEFAEAADIASDALGAFGLDSKDSTKKMEGLNRVMDVMSLTANSTNVSVAELFETVKKGAPVAIKAGQSVETFAAIAGTLASVGIKGSEAGTATKNIALALAGVGNQAGKTFKALGIALVKPDGKMRDIADVFDDLSKVTKGMDEDKVLAVMNAIFGKISLASAANLLGEGSNKIRKLRAELEKAGGSSKRTAEFIRNDVKGSIDGLNSAVEGVKISIFSLNEGPLKEAIDKMTAWVRINEKAIGTNIGGFLLDIINNFKNIVEWAKRIGMAIGVFIAFSVVLSTLTGILALVNLLMAANPVTLIILGIVILTAALTAVVFWWDELKAVFMGLPGPIRAIIGVLFLLSGPIGWLILAAGLIIDNWEPIKQFFINLWPDIVSIFNSSIEWISDLINAFANSPQAASLLNSWESIKQFFIGLWPIVIDAFNKGVNKVLSIIDIMQGTIGGMPAVVMEKWQSIKQFFIDLWGDIVNIFSISIDKIMSLIDGVKTASSFVADKASMIGGDIADFFGFGDKVNASLVVKPVTEITKTITGIAPQTIGGSANDDEFNPSAANRSSQVISPQERVARSIEERRETRTAEITIKTDENTQAEVTNGKLGNSIKLQSSGGF